MLILALGKKRDKLEESVTLIIISTINLISVGTTIHDLSISINHF